MQEMFRAEGVEHFPVPTKRGDRAESDLLCESLFQGVKSFARQLRGILAE